MLSLLSPSLLLLPLLQGANAFKFTPETSNLFAGAVSNLPVPYDLTTTMNASGTHGGDSYWSSSYIYGSDKHEYLVLSHVRTGLAGLETMYRASIYDITSKVFNQFEYLTNITDVFQGSDVFNASFGDYYYGSTSAEDAVTELRTWSTVSDVEFDLTFGLNSPVLLNGGTGAFECVNATCNEWSMPSGKTTGSLIVNGTTVTVDTNRSFTWFDRQWIAPTNWTWFELNLQSGVPGELDTKMSVWNYQGTTHDVHFASIRESSGVQTITPITKYTEGNRIWTSPHTGVTYVLDWHLTFVDGTDLHISSHSPDQELHMNGTLPTYEGFITAEGKYKGKKRVTGFGLVEIFPLQ